MDLSIAFDYLPNGFFQALEYAYGVDSCAQFISEAIGNRYLWPENCFELVQRLTEPAKSQFMVLSKSTVKYSTEIIDKKIFLFKSVKLLGLTIESYFDIYLQGFQTTKYSTSKITLKFVYLV